MLWHPHRDASTGCSSLASLNIDVWGGNCVGQTRTSIRECLLTSRILRTESLFVVVCSVDSPETTSLRFSALGISAALLPTRKPSPVVEDCWGSPKIAACLSWVVPVGILVPGTVAMVPGASSKGDAVQWTLFLLFILSVCLYDLAFGLCGHVCYI